MSRPVGLAVVFPLALGSVLACGSPKEPSPLHGHALARPREASTSLPTPTTPARTISPPPPPPELDAPTPDVVDAGSLSADAGETTATRVSVKLPGACVDPTRHAAEHVARSNGTTPEQEVEFVEEFSSELDLDGDGVNDAARFIGATGVTSEHLYYVMRGTCGHFVGQIASMGLRTLSSTHHGLKDLGGEIECPPADCCYEEWRFDGTRYKRAVTRPSPDCPHLW